MKDKQELKTEKKAGRILFCQEEPSVYGDFKRAAEESGYRIDFSPGFGGCAEDIEKKTYDVIIADAEVTDLKEVCARLEKFYGEEGKKYIFLILALKRKNIPPELIHRNNVFYIKKPAETDDLIQYVGQNMNLLHAFREKDRYCDKLVEANNKLTETLIELRKMRNKLLYSEKLALIGNMASGVAHDLRTPLSSIENVTYYIKNYADVRDPEAAEYLDVLSREIRTIDKKLSNLINFTGKIKLIKGKINIRQLVDDAVDSLDVPQTIAVHVDIEPEAEYIYADREKFGLALRNIIKNAVSAVDRKNGVVAVSCSLENEVSTLKVSDNGCGMGSEAVNTVYDPTYTTRAKGIGLGLPMAKEILRRHNGMINIKSAPGKGTEVEMRLPAE